MQERPLLFVFSRRSASSSIYFLLFPHLFSSFPWLEPRLFCAFTTIFLLGRGFLSFCPLHQTLSGQCCSRISALRLSFSRLRRGEKKPILAFNADELKKGSHFLYTVRVHPLLFLTFMCVSAQKHLVFCCLSWTIL